MPPEHDLISTVKTAQILEVDRSTITRLVSAGKIAPVMRVSDGPTGAMLFSRTEIEAFALSLQAAS